MHEEFYGVIKLVSGEEIVSKVCPLDEEDKTLLMLDSPVVLTTIIVKQLGVTTVKIEPWLKYADDSLCVINMEKVITVSEVKDETIIFMYEKYLKDKNKKSGRTKITPNMGFIANISEARATLEKIYNKNNY
jgi:hypothetical protein